MALGIGNSINAADWEKSCNHRLCIQTLSLQWLFYKHCWPKSHLPILSSSSIVEKRSPLGEWEWKRWVTPCRYHIRSAIKKRLLSKAEADRVLKTQANFVGRCAEANILLAAD
jgi:hypothetical protein